MMQEQAIDNRQSGSPFCPFSLRIECLDRMLNFELVNHPIYTGMEIQGHEAQDDSDSHGILVFLQRRDTNQTDVYLQKAVHLEESTKKLFSLGSGLGVWQPTDFDMAELHVSGDNGVHAEVMFQDVDGRHIYIKISDETPFCRQHRNMCKGFLAPVGVAIEKPQALPLIYMTDFDLLTRRGTPPIITIDGEPAPVGSMPGEKCLNKRLIKVAKDLVIVSVNTTGSNDGDDKWKRSNIYHFDEDGNLTSIAAHKNGHCASMTFDPSFPNVAKALTGGPDHSKGRWRVGIDDDTRLVSGTWTTQRMHEEDRKCTLQVQLDVTKGWRPKGLPWLTKVITTLVPVFRTWPESYRWIGAVEMKDGDILALQSFRWERTAGDRGESYTKAFGKATAKR